ncbi:MAG: sigma-70 family RNA polymerase sigma factor [Betaproteobacteria bacterium]|nr:sigma-70 family RNA polymerase sigma factor [Betaproteobacteria bacterium]
MAVSQTLASETLDREPAGNTGPRLDAQIACRGEARTKPHLVVEYIPNLRRYARALVRDRDAADDLVQDTLERASNKLLLWRPGSDMRAWLFTIMHNVFINQRRKHRFEVALDCDDLPELAVMPTQAQGIELADIEKALQGISAEQREVLLLIAVEEMSYDEVAKTLSIPIGTVMSRLSRARERLRQLMNAAG